jgi:hypothetical protein
MDALVNQILWANIKNTDDVVQFRQKDFFKQRSWKGQLAERAAAFVDQTNLDVLIARKEDVEIRVRGKVLIGKTLKASFSVRDRRMHVLISPESYQRYEAWKASGGILVETPSSQ